jgi:hypothetical protein
MLCSLANDFNRLTAVIRMSNATVGFVPEADLRRCLANDSFAAGADCWTFPQTGDIQSVAMRSKCLRRKTNLVLQSAGFVAIFNRANYSNGMGLMQVIAVEVATLYCSILRYTLR